MLFRKYFELLFPTICVRFSNADLVAVNIDFDLVIQLVDQPSSHSRLASLDNHEEAHLVLLDFSKAFD